MNIHLLLHNFFYLFTILLSLFIIVLLFIKGGSRVEKITLSLALLGCIIFVVSHVLGVSVSDSELSRRILMFNTVDIFIPIFSSHCTFALIGKTKEYKYFIISTYIIGFSLLLFFIINPYNFLLTSVPKMYFPNYYVAGKYYFLMLFFFFFLIVFTFIVMRKAYVLADSIDKNRIKYFGIAVFLGYAVGSINFLLIYNINIDPLWGFFFIPLFSIPFAYAIVQYELMDIKVVAKRAFVYISISAIFAFVLISLNYLNSLIIRSNPDFPNWASSLIISLLVSIGLLFIWRKIRETDLLKYEFINIISHKFRTPLTAIKWSSDNLIENAPEDLKKDVKVIQKSTRSLVDLTNILVGVSNNDRYMFEYKLDKVDLSNVVENIISDHLDKINDKKITINSLPKATYFVLADEHKIKFVFQTLIFNAINYNKIGGEIYFNLSKPDGKNIIFEIKDTGIGIGEKEIKHMFTKFYRTNSSRKADTEGMGIGLYLTKEILERHNGKIWVKSEGLEKGSSFFVSLPIYK
jgi:signal transduction histidine kinase